MGRLTRMGFWLTAVAPALLLAGFAARAEDTAGSVCDKPLAMVEGKVITASEVEEQIQPQMRALAGQHEGAELAERVAELRRITATDMAEEELLYAEFRKHEEFKVPQEMIRRRMDSIIQMQAGGSREKFEQRLLAQGASWNEFEERVRKSVAVELLLDQFVRRQVRITPAEIRDYYAKHPAEFSTAARLRLSMIQLKPDGKYTGKLEETAKLIRHEVGQGADFGWLAQNYSEAANAGDKGDLGWIKESDVAAAFREAAKGLAAGTVAEPITVEGSLVVLKVTGREEAVLQPLDEALYRRIENQLRDAAEKKKLEEYLNGLKKKFQFKLFF